MMKKELCPPALPRKESLLQKAAREIMKQAIINGMGRTPIALSP